MRESVRYEIEYEAKRRIYKLIDFKERPEGYEGVQVKMISKDALIRLILKEGKDGY
jgi:hypothetical protein